MAKPEGAKDQASEPVPADPPADPPTAPTETDTEDAIAQVIELTEANERLEQEATELRSQLDALAAKGNDLQAKVDELTSQLEQAATVRTSYENDVTNLEREIVTLRRTLEDRQAEQQSTAPSAGAIVPTGQGIEEHAGFTPSTTVRIRTDHRLGDEASVYAGHAGVIVEIDGDEAARDDGTPFLVDFGDPSRPPATFAVDELVRL